MATKEEIYKGWKIETFLAYRATKKNSREIKAVDLKHLKKMIDTTE